MIPVTTERLPKYYLYLAKAEWGRKSFHFLELSDYEEML
jgi:hypothetical protein